MTIKSIEDLRAILKKSGVRLKPLSLNELETIETQLRHPLPLVYKEFLLSMGKGAGDFMLGSSVFLDELPDLQEGGRELLAENNMEPLPDNAFVFWMHQGYQMAYFILGESDNPTVYYFSESFEDKAFVQEKSLLNFFESELAASGFRS